MKTPVINSEYKILFQPKENGNYVNDHSIVKGSDGKWHLYGITSFAGIPREERYFVHGVGEDLNSCFREVGRSIDTGTLAWAPCVIEKDKNYYMFYGPSPTKLAVSPNMYEWFGYNVNLNNEPLMGAHRDHFVLKLNESEYLMYIVGLYNKRGSVSCFYSKDLINWDFKGFALTSGENAPLNPAWGAFESPYVIKKDGKFYLFITYTNGSDETYNNTFVFCSDNPEYFGKYDGDKGKLQPLTILHAHAPEILEENGKYYITTCGWNFKPVPNKGAVSIAELIWK